MNNLDKLLIELFGFGFFTYIFNCIIICTICALGLSIVVLIFYIYDKITEFVKRKLEARRNKKGKNAKK